MNLRRMFGPVVFGLMCLFPGLGATATVPECQATLVDFDCSPSRFNEVIVHDLLKHVLDEKDPGI